MNDFDLDDIPLGNDSDAPIPFNNDRNAPIPFDDDLDDDDNSVSHSPLDLGGGNSKAEPDPMEIEPLEIEPLTEPAPAISPTIAAAAAPDPVASGERITGVKTFFTKLHAGALDFLGEQINGWLKKNPNIFIKHTNTACGTIVGKKAEPSLIVTVWY